MNIPTNSTDVCSALKVSIKNVYRKQIKSSKSELFNVKNIFKKNPSKKTPKTANPNRHLLRRIEDRKRVFLVTNISKSSIQKILIIRFMINSGVSIVVPDTVRNSMTVHSASRVYAISITRFLRRNC